MCDCKNKPVLIRLPDGKPVNPAHLIEINPVGEDFDVFIFSVRISALTYDMHDNGEYRDSRPRWEVRYCDDFREYKYDTKQEAEAAYNELISKFEVI